MRLSEACGVLTSDIWLDGVIPHINLTAHPWLNHLFNAALAELALQRSLSVYRGKAKHEDAFALIRYCPQRCTNQWHSPLTTFSLQ